MESQLWQRLYVFRYQTVTVSIIVPLRVSIKTYSTVFNEFLDSSNETGMESCNRRTDLAVYVSLAYTQSHLDRAESGALVTGSGRGVMTRVWPRR